MTLIRMELSNVYLSNMYLLPFAGFLRLDELSNLCLMDLTLDEDKLTIKIWSSKMDQLKMLVRW